MRGNYSKYVEEIVSEYLKANYHMTMTELDEVVKNILVFVNKTYETTIDGIDFKFSDAVTSNTVAIVSNELNNSSEYDFKNMEFKPGDTVIDIGGNIGIVSIYLAKKYPFLKIYAFEPVRQNYENFQYNIMINNIPKDTITLENKAVTADGRDVNMAINLLNSGGSSISDIVTVGTVQQEVNNNIQSTTLKEIFTKYKIETLRLLKIDCEGSEYEILKNTPETILKNITSLRGEFHENLRLIAEYNADELLNYVTQYITDTKIVKATGCFVV